MDHRLNFFPITNQNQLNLHYHLIEIGSIPEGVDFSHNLELIRKHVQREFGTPATSIIRSGKRFLAVGTQPKKKNYPTNFDAPILQGLVVPLYLSSETSELNLANSTEDDRHIITSFIDFELRSKLRTDDKQLWKGNSPYIFYSKQPTPLSEDLGNINLYSGFSCRTEFVPDIGFGLVMDMASVFLDSMTLAQRRRSGEDWRNWVGRYFVYEFGLRWYFIQLKNMEKKTISEAQFVDPRSGDTTNLFAYLNDYWKGRKYDGLEALEKDDWAVTYGSSNQKGERYAAAALIRLRYKTNEEPAQNCHKKTILHPDDRMHKIQNMIHKYLDGRIRLEGIALNIADQPASVPYRVFPIPAQRFGRERVLYPPQITPQSIEENWRKRKSWLQNAGIGIYHDNDSGLKSQFFMMPSSIDDEDLADQIEQDIKEAIRKYSPIPYNPKLVVWDDETPRNLPEILAEINKRKSSMSNAGTACCVFVLPEQGKIATGKLRRHIKKTLAPQIRTKCIQVKELIRLKQAAKNGDGKAAGRYQSYLTYTALDVLVTNGYRLWVLKESLNYDLYIGIDVLNHIAGFTFVAAGGAICRFIPSESEQPEQLSAEQIVEVLGKQLREVIPRFKELMGRLPHHIVIHRDGRWYKTESQGFNIIADRLYHEKLLPENVIKGVIEIQKTNAQRWRLLAHNKNRFDNPIVGSYCVFTSQRGIICTTGSPARVPGTAKPLLANIAEGNLDMEKSLRDIYWLSTLAWSKPDGVQSLPITIKLADAWLEPIAAATDENEGRYGVLDDTAAE